MDTIFSQSFVEKLGWTLLHFVWQGAAVALLLAMLLRILRGSTANLRYIIGCAALVLMILAPIATMFMITDSAVHGELAEAEVSTSPVVMVSEAPELPVEEPLALVEAEPLPYVAAPAPLAWKEQVKSVLEAAMPYLVLGWMIGVFGLSTWRLGGWTQIQFLKRRMVKPVDISWQAKLANLTERLGITRTVRMLESALVEVPTVVGWLKPVILIPASSLMGITSQQLEAVLLHELAHIRRFDYLVNLLQTLAETLGFYHPAVWWVSRRIRVERENCCDDVAVQALGDRVSYARALTRMEESRKRSPELAVAANGSSLLHRVGRLLGYPGREKTRLSQSWPVALIIMATFIVAAFVFVNVRAETSAAEPGQSDTGAAQYLLKQMVAMQSRLKNVQFIVEYDQYYRGPSTDEAAIKKMTEQWRSMGKSEAVISRMVDTRREYMEQQSATPHRYQTYRWAIDVAGRARFEMTEGHYDETGKQLSSGTKNIVIWDGTHAIDYMEKEITSPVAIFGIQQPFETTKRFRQPLRTYGGNFIDALSDAIKKGVAIEIQQLNDGRYHVSFPRNKGTQTAIIDPKKGFAVTVREFYLDGSLAYRYTADFEEIEQGIWFPVSGKAFHYSQESPGKLSREAAMKAAQVKINNPEFKRALFQLDCAEGTQVIDGRTGERFVLEKPLRLRLGGLQGDVTLARIWDFALSDGGGGSAPIHKNSSSQSATKPTFGPVIERVVPDAEYSAQELVKNIRASEQRIRDVSVRLDLIFPHQQNRIAVTFDWGYEGGKEYIDGTQFVLAKKDKGLPERTIKIKYAFDGEKAYLFRDSPLVDWTAGKITTFAGISFTAYLRPTALLGFDVSSGRRSFGELLRDAQAVSLKPGLDSIGERPCAVLEAIGIADGEATWDVRVWIDQERDFRPLRIEKYDSVGGDNRFKIIRNIIDKIELRQIDDMWFPVGGTRTSFQTKTALPPEGMTMADFEKLPPEIQMQRARFLQVPMPSGVRVIKVHEETIQINKGIEDEMFTVKFPPGCRVWNDFLDMGYTQSESLVGSTLTHKDSSSQTSAKPTFGPVIERVLDYGTLIDFDTGTLLRPPQNLDINDTAALGAWAIQTGADAVADSTKASLRSLDMAVGRIYTDWNDAKRGLIIGRLRSAGTKSVLFPQGGSPKHVFKTREGGWGELQFVGFTENPKGVKIRYKMVQQGQPATQVGEESASGRRRQMDKNVIFEAIELGDIVRVQQYLTSGSDINVRKDYHDGPPLKLGDATPLHLAIVLDNKNIVDLLIANGADVNAKAEGDITPLVAALFKEDKRMIELLLANGANVNTIIDGGFTPLHIAYADGNKEIIDLLIANGADVNAKEENGLVPMELNMDTLLMDTFIEVMQLLKK